MDYPKFYAFLEDAGFELVDKFDDCDRKRNPAPNGKRCGGFIDHVVYRRKAIASA